MFSTSNTVHPNFHERRSKGEYIAAGKRKHGLFLWAFDRQAYVHTFRFAYTRGLLVAATWCLPFSGNGRQKTIRNKCKTFGKACVKCWLTKRVFSRNQWTHIKTMTGMNKWMAQFLFMRKPHMPSLAGNLVCVKW